MTVDVWTGRDYGKRARKFGDPALRGGSVYTNPEGVSRLVQPAAVNEIGWGGDAWDPSDLERLFPAAGLTQGGAEFAEAEAEALQRAIRDAIAVDPASRGGPNRMAAPPPAPNTPGSAVPAGLLGGMGTPWGSGLQTQPPPPSAGDLARQSAMDTAGRNEQIQTLQDLIASTQAGLVQPAVNAGGAAPPVGNDYDPSGFSAAIANAGAFQPPPVTGGMTQADLIAGILGNVSTNEGNEAARLAAVDTFMGQGMTPQQISDFLATLAPAGPGPAGPVPGPAGPVPGPAGPVPGPAGPVPGPAGPVPGPAGPVPGPAGPGPAAPAPTTQETAADAIDNVQVTLGKQNSAIQKALQSGLIDISTAAEMWDTQRQQIYKDFVDQYGGAGDQYATEDERIAGQRAAERTKILADLDMRGVDASMVGEELSILDALVGSQTNANVDYMSEMGDIAGMADRDRQWLSGVSTDAEGNLLRHPAGEDGAPGRAVLGGGVFGGYEQDLRSQMRNLGLGLEIDSATAEGERLDQALASNALAERFGMSPGTMMGGMVGGVDLPGMAYGTSERLGAEKFAEGESALNRTFATGERLAGQTFTSGENELGRTWQGGENDLTRGIQADAFAESQRQFNQGVRTDAAGNIRDVNERAEDVAYRDAMLAADETAATQTQDNLDRAYDAAMMGVDTREFIPGAGKAGAGSAMMRNPEYGMSATEQADFALDLIAAQQAAQGSPPDPVERGEDWLFREMLYSVAGDAELAGKLARTVKDRIGANENVIGGGLTENNMLWALATLGEQAENDEEAAAFRAVYDQLLRTIYAEDYGLVNSASG